MRPHLEACALGFRFGGSEIIRALSMRVFEGEFVALVGPSGCGKTTLLKLLSGQIEAQTGSIVRHGESRTIYQQGALLPWFTVTENIQLGMRSLRNRSEKDKETRFLIQLIQMEGFESYYPHQLSGGMKQRVELARALGGHSDILLMDEPFSAVDYLTRVQLRQHLIRILAERPRTVVFVTHDIEEAAQIADRVLVLTARPLQVRSEIAIHAPKPRDATSWAVVDASRRLHEELHTFESTNEVVMS